MNILHNARLALRSLRRTAAFTIAAALTLAIGIGLSTAVFTIADAMLLRRLPVRDQNRIVLLAGAKRDLAAQPPPLSFADAQDFAGQTSSLQAVAWYGYEGAAQKTVRDGENIAQMRRALVSGTFFEVLGAMLFETVPADPVVLMFVVAVLLVVTTVASFIPAWSTTRIDPAIALRSDD